MKNAYCIGRATFRSRDVVTNVTAALLLLLYHYHGETLAAMEGREGGGGRAKGNL